MKSSCSLLARAAFYSPVSVKTIPCANCKKHLPHDQYQAGKLRRYLVRPWNIFCKTCAKVLPSPKKAARLSKKNNNKRMKSTVVTIST
jgi:phage FluMu protein Com